jgi:hypothetical protein
MIEHKVLPFRLDIKSYKLLKKLADLKQVKMAHIIRDLIHEEIQNNRKFLQRNDIAI